jgi:hypothetical protein
LDVRSDGDFAKLRRSLKMRGFAAFDRADEGARNDAIAISLGVSLKRLGALQPRFMELALFPEDVDIPFVTMARLWAQTAGLSLFTHYKPDAQTVRLHDVIGAY